MEEPRRPSTNSDSQSERAPPRERFAQLVTQLDLNQKRKELEPEKHDGQSGHRQIALYKHDHSTVALFQFKQGGFMREHKANGTVFIHVIEGCLTLDVEGANHVLNNGGMLILAAGVSHDVRAERDTTMLLTVCLP